jgi:hypothetical protein
MNVHDIINEEFDKFLNEIEPSQLKTFPFEKISSNNEGTQYKIKIEIPEKQINTAMIVYLSQFSNEYKGYGISFKESGGNYSDKTGFGIQFSLLSTISKIVTEFVGENNPNILSFQPVQKESDRSNPNKKTSPYQRLLLYLRFIKTGAGQDFDAFVLGNNYKVSVEKKNPSFPIENGYQDQETIQDILTQLSVYMGYYEADVPKTDRDYMKFTMTDFGGMNISTPNGYTSVVSVRKFVDEMISVPNLTYVYGTKEPVEISPEEREQQLQRQRQQGQQPQGQRAVQPVRRDSQATNANIGSFMHFLQNHIYGQPEFEPLDPYFETTKNMNDFTELRNRANNSLSNARTDNDRQRLLGIVDAVDRLDNTYQRYQTQYGVNDMSENILTEVEENLMELFKL